MVKEIEFKATMRIRGISSMFPNERQLRVLREHITIKNI